MASLAILAKLAGYKVTGSDSACYPPMKDLLAQNNINWTDNFDDSVAALKADEIIVGNAIKRGNKVFEEVLNSNKKYISGPQWLQQNILPKYKVAAITGTHGKTTTTSMLIWILQQNKQNPSYLVGGYMQSLKTSANLARGEWFIIEADEYDSALFDKRPKFMHYRPKLVITNNIEFDHADIYNNLEEIQTQFHNLYRTMAQNSSLIINDDDKNIKEVLEKDFYAKVTNFSATNSKALWHAKIIGAKQFEVYYDSKKIGVVNWELLGKFNVENALAAISASSQMGVLPSAAIKALESYNNTKRRLEIIACINKVTIFDDFAHHPTAIQATYEALAAEFNKVILIIEKASYSMRHNVHQKNMHKFLSTISNYFFVDETLTDTKITDIISSTCEGDAIVFMSNKSLKSTIDRFLASF